MPRAGPFDKRTQVRRCTACQRRKIKCVGGIPCEYCAKTRQLCNRDAANRQATVVFVSSGHQAQTSRSQQNPTASPKICAALSTTKSDWGITYFFEDFLKTNDFAAGLWTRAAPNIYQLLHTSPTLRDAITSVAVLDSSRRPTSRYSTGPLKAQENALKTYSSSLVALQSALNAKGASEDTIWATFFLGLFELMMGTDANNWDRHFLYGTSRLMRACGPNAFRQGSGRALFLTLRFFEVSRSLIYNDSSFLMEPAWFSLLNVLREESQADELRNETILDVMLRCSDLCSRLLRCAPDYSSNFDIFLEEGACLRAIVEMILQDQDLPEPDARFPDELVAFVFLHATSIYLSGIFDYRLHLFSAAPTATISRDRVKIHVASILKGTKIAINETKFCGLLFLYPLRVAAARATGPAEQEQIMDAFDKIGQQGFAIVQVFRQEIREVWDRGRSGGVMHNN